MTFENVTIVGASMNVAVQCPMCGTVFDATGGGDGTFDTSPDGRLRLREAVFEATTAILSRPLPRPELEAAIEALRRPTGGPVPQELVDVDGFRKLWQWMNDNPAFGYLVAPLIVGVLLLLLQRAVPDDDPPDPPARVTVVVHQPREEDLRRLVDQVLREQPEGSPPPADPGPAGTSGPGSAAR